MLVWNEEQESPSNIVFLCSSQKDYFSFERGKKSFLSSSIPTILVCFLVVYIAFDQKIRFKVFNYVALTCDEVTTLAKPFWLVCNSMFLPSNGGGSS